MSYHKRRPDIAESAETDPVKDICRLGSGAMLPVFGNQRVIPEDSALTGDSLRISWMISEPALKLKACLLFPLFVSFLRLLEFRPVYPEHACEPLLFRPEKPGTTSSGGAECLFRIRKPQRSSKSWVPFREESPPPPARSRGGPGSEGGGWGGGVPPLCPREGHFHSSGFSSSL